MITAATPRHNKSWAEWEVTYLHEMKGERTIKEIAGVLGRTAGAVMVKSQPRHSPTYDLPLVETRSEEIPMQIPGLMWTIDYAAKQIGVCAATISRWCGLMKNVYVWNHKPLRCWLAAGLGGPPTRVIDTSDLIAWLGRNKIALNPTDMKRAMEVIVEKIRKVTPGETPTPPQNLSTPGPSL